MKFAAKVRIAVFAALWVFAGNQAFAQQGTVRVLGVVRDETNAIALPGVPVEIVGTKEVVYTDVDGRYVVQVPPGKHEVKVVLEGYQEKVITIEAAGDRPITLDVGLTMSRFAETVEVTATLLTAETSSAEAQLIERKQAPVITDNIGSQEMKDNGDRDAAVRHGAGHGRLDCRELRTSSCAGWVSATATRRSPARCCPRLSRTRKLCRWICSRRV